MNLHYLQILKVKVEAPMMKRILTIAISCVLTFTTASAAPISRIKDIADFSGVRSNMLIGYGLVVGLNGTGDAANSIPFTRQTLVDMLGKLGMNSAGVANQIKTKNVASVMITADMPSYARQGSRLDINVASLGDAKSLEGGTLIATALIGADGQTYAVAQGSIVLGGYETDAGAQEHLTSGKIPAGATVEVETGHELANNENLRLVLRNPDFTTAIRVQNAINEAFKEPVSQAIDNGTIDIAVPEALREVMAAVIQKVENVRVRPDGRARVVIDEKAGTIVMGEGVQISDVAISHANLSVRISQLQEIIQPAGMEGLTVAQEDPNADTEGQGQFQMFEPGVTLADLVDGLNALGVKPKDIVSILQTIKAAGALQADIVLM